MTKRLLLHQNGVFCCILRVGKCNRSSSIPSPISSYVSLLHICAWLLVSMELPKFSRRRQEICSSPPRPPSILCAWLFDGRWLAGRERGMRFCLLICQQIATDGPLQNGFSKLLFQGRTNPFYEIAAQSSCPSIVSPPLFLCSFELISYGYLPLLPSPRAVLVAGLHLLLSLL